MSRIQPAVLVDFVKVTRAEWLTRADLQHETGHSLTTVRLWTEELVKQGLLTARIGQRQGRRGVAPIYFTLRPEWGGQAAGASQ